MTDGWHLDGADNSHATSCSAINFFNCWFKGMDNTIPLTIQKKGPESRRLQVKHLWSSGL